MDITKCDKCKKIKREKHPSFDEKSKWIDVAIHGRGKFLSFDLCGKCSNNLVKYVKRYLKD